MEEPQGDIYHSNPAAAGAGSESITLLDLSISVSISAPNTTVVTKGPFVRSKSKVHERTHNTILTKCLETVKYCPEHCCELHIIPLSNSVKSAKTGRGFPPAGAVDFWRVAGAKSQWRGPG